MKNITAIAFICGLSHLAFSQNFGIDNPSPLTKLHLSGEHSTTRARLTLPAANNSGGTGEINLQLWVSEPGVTWDAGGIGTNVNNDGGSPVGFARLNTVLGQSYIRFITNGGAMAFSTTNNAGTNFQTMYLANGNVGIGTTSPSQTLDINGEAIRKVAIASGYNQQDGTDNGVIGSRVLTYNKKYGAGVTGLRVTYSDGFRTYTAGTSAKACRWEVRFNGGSCATPGPVAYDVYEEATNQNFHHSGTFAGTCKSLGAGTYTVQVYVSPAPGYPVCDCYTGWQGMWELMVEEVRF